MCATEIPAEHGHVADLERPRWCAPAAPATCCSPTPRRAGAGTGRCPTGTGTTRRAPMTVAEWDEFEIPVGLAFFLRSSPGRRGGRQRLLPEPGGSHRVPLDLEAWERLAAEHPLLAAAASRRGGRPDHPHGCRGRVFPGAYRRLLRAGRADAAALARLRRRDRGPGKHRRVPGQRPVPGPGLQPGAPRWLSWPSTARAPCRPVRRDPGDVLHAADQRDQRARRSRRSRCAARSGSSRPGGGTPRPRRSGSTTCSARPSAGPRRCGRCSSPPSP